MNGNEKLDPAIVAVKPANKPVRPGKEWAEPEGNARDQHGVRARNRAAPSSGNDRVHKAAHERKTERFTTVLHHMDAVLLRQAYHRLKRDAAPGVDGMTWDAYGEGWTHDCATLRASTGAPTGHGRVCVPTFRNRTDGNGWRNSTWS